MKDCEILKSMSITRAITQIEITAANVGKLAALDALAAEYMRVCQLYVTNFCETGEMDGYGEPFVTTLLSERWQRVAMMQAQDADAAVCFAESTRLYTDIGLEGERARTCALWAKL